MIFFGMKTMRRLFEASLVLILLLGCGDRKAQYEVDQKVSGVTWPTQQNYPQWKKIWDGESWIVGLLRERQDLKSRVMLTGAVAEGLALAVYRDDLSIDRKLFAFEFSRQLVSHVVPILNFERSLSSGAGPAELFGFAEVRFKGGLPGLQSVLMGSTTWKNRISNFGSADEKNGFLLNWFWSSLESVAGVEFAEPNLESQVQQDTSTNKDELAVRFEKQWNTSLIGADQLVPAMRKGNTAVVAVIDTGVDNIYDSPGMALENRLYRNVAEDPAAGGKPQVDDDGNGWVDDFIGVDASIPKGSADLGPAVIPGSNDVGGPGVACAQGSGVGSSNCGHGTHVAGIVAGGGPAASGFVGVCPINCKILPIRAAKRCVAPKGVEDASKAMLCPRFGETVPFDPNSQIEMDGGISDISQLQALGYILDLTVPGRPDLLVTNVVNLSIGKYFSSRALSFTARRLIANDVLLVAAAGNQNVEIPMFPAAYRDVVAVCSTSHDVGDGDGRTTEPTGSSDPKQGENEVRGRRLKSRFSNFGDWVDICAPGSNIRSIVPGGNAESKFNSTDTKSGTSQASPHVAGLAAVVKAVSGGLTARDIRSILITYANFDLLYGRLADGSLANQDFAFAPYKDSKVFMLGSGMLSAVYSLYALTDPAKAREFVSQASAAIEAGDTNQVTSGCVVSSLAATHPLKSIEAATSLPVVLLLGFLLFKLIRVVKKWPGRRRA
ncbi:MAG: S8 family serine peptidase [Silvanigrellaceae bacterium]